MSLFVNYLDIDGLSLKDIQNYYISIEGLFDTDHNVVMNDLYSDGQSYNRGKVKEKKILLQGLIRGDIVTNLFKLKQYLYKAGLKKLTVGVAGMPIVYILVDILNWVSDPDDPEIVSCQVVAPNPYLYSVDTGSISLGVVSNTGLTFPLTFPIIFGEISGGQGTITNVGNATTYPIITVVGTCSDITITNTTTGESMSLDVSLIDTDLLVIDNTASNRGVYLNGIKRMDLKQGNWLSCPPGDNLFTFQRTSLQTKQHCSIQMKSRWI